MAADRLTRADVVAAYRLMLSRFPETEELIENHIRGSTFEQMLSVILSSEEFQARLQKIDLRRFPVGAVGVQREASSCMRRLEHLAGLNLPILGKSVIDAGAGLGLMASFFLDRMCALQLVDLSPTLLRLAQLRLAANEAEPATNVSFMPLDLDKVRPGEVEPRQIVVCCDTLWQAKDIRGFLDALSAMTDECLVLETRCAFGEQEVVFLNEDPDPEKMGGVRIATNVYPTRPWLWARLSEIFEHVYMARTQPIQADFPLDWTVRSPASGQAFGRVVFVASRRPLAGEMLSSRLENVLTRAS